MNVRVNLIKDTELRHVGMVSRSFIIRVSSITAATVLVLFLIIFIGRYKLVQQQLAGARDRWETMKPAYDRVRVLRQDLTDRRKIMGELTGWNNSRIDWVPPLAELQQTVPPTIQLTKLMLRGELSMKEPKVTTPPPDPDKPPPEIPATPMRRYFINIYGRASGTLADQVVIHFVRTFRQTPAFQKILEGVKLQRLQKEAGGEKGAEQPDRAFEIEAVSLYKEMK